MDIKLNAADEAFRREVKKFLAEHVPPSPILNRSQRFGGQINTIGNWQKVLYEKGWSAPNWPKQYGGTGWNETQKHIWYEESTIAGAPGGNGFGLHMAGPVIYTFGTDAQKEQHLKGILSGEISWCQGYSEPGAGSDLASLKTSAMREGDDYIVNGQKIWTSFAHLADWMFCLVRTDSSGKPQEGISFLLIDMKTPGIEVRPIVSIDHEHHLNEVYFTDVRVPVTNRVGEENKGWTYAKFVLANERTGIAGVAGRKIHLKKLKELASLEYASDGRKLAEEEAFQRRLADLEIRLMALEITSLRILSDVAAGREPGPGASSLKIFATEISQELETMTLEAAAHYALPRQNEIIHGGNESGQSGPHYLAEAYIAYAIGRASTIYGGTNEIQRNVIAKSVLGL